MCLSLVPSENQSKYANFFLQWHVTSLCDQTCKHCYMYDSPFYKNEKENPLSFNACKSVVDDYLTTVRELDVESSITFSGGDPLLREDFFDILAYCNQVGITNLSIAGNPFHISFNSAKALKKMNISTYQISLDGDEEIHDSLRKKGSFISSLSAFRTLKDAGIQTGCMFTLSKLNADKIFEIIKLCSDFEISYFTFDRLVPTGNGKEMQDQMISAGQYQELLIQIKEAFDIEKSKGSKTYFAFKDNLCNILVDSQTPYKLNDSSDSMILKRECLIGKTGFAILADGTVLACRRLPLRIGKVPEDKLIDIYKNSKCLQNLQDVSKIETCKSCSMEEKCYGCRAVAYGFSSGDLNSADPQCFYHLK